MGRSHATSSDSSPAGRIVRFDRGETVFRQGDAGAEMYIIRQGSVQVLQKTAAAEKELAVLEKGDFFGEMSLLENLPRSATVRALTEVELVEISAATFDRMLRGNPEIAVRIMRKLSRRLRDTDRLVNRLAGGGAPLAAEPPGAAAEAAGEAPWRLLHRDEGVAFPVRLDADTSIGRLDPVTGFRPEVDLTGVDIERSSSRRHASIRPRGGSLFLVEEIGTTNGTFVNGRRIAKGEPVPIQGGDVLRFGLVELTLHES